MRLIFRFLRPHWKLCLITVFLLIVDVVGALIIPTLASEMMREGEAGAGFSTLAKTAVVMALAAIISGAGGILSGYTCAALTARVGKDMREALYKNRLIWLLPISARSASRRSPRAPYRTSRISTSRS